MKWKGVYDKTMIFRMLSIALVLTAWVMLGQVQTEVPPVVAGAKPVTLERIKVHGAALEGNLEGNKVDRDVIVVLPPGYTSRRAGATPLSMRCTVIR